jgi:hypothetical protein
MIPGKYQLIGIISALTISFIYLVIKEIKKVKPLPGSKKSVRFPSMKEINEPEDIPEELFKIPSNIFIRPTWFSNDYVCFYFMYKGQKHSIWEIKEPMLNGEDYAVSDKTVKLGNGDFEYEKNKRWATLGDCLKHNLEMWKGYKIKQQELEKQRERNRLAKQEAYKRANS